jgi:hypothetical protein
MSVLGNAVFFGGSEDIDGDDLAKSEVNNFTDSVDRALKSFHGWKGKAIAVLGLTLTPDNLRIASGKIITRGSLDLKDKKIAANLIWPAAKENVAIVIQFPSADTFSFTDSSGLWSDIMSDNEIAHHYCDTTEGRGAQPLLATDERRVGTVGQGFSIRMLLQICSLSSQARGVVLKYAIILFPAGAEELATNPESKFPGWPGIKIAEGTIPLGPKPSQPWKCPVIPFLLPATPFQDEDVAPRSHKLRVAVAGIMRNVKAADTLKVHFSLCFIHIIDTSLASPQDS